ncbi:MAG: exodeoxyribonuclease VII large subunit [Planctomycetes bacterium]|nr:exodeoxyribonuclease VII large subunit [Planctomycetota bacterium]
MTQRTLDFNVSPVLSVSQLTMLVKETLENQFDTVWVRGELSNVSRPRSGHIYLTLKDDGAQIPAVIWRTLANRLPFEIKDGMAAICSGGVEVYPPHGKYQLVIRDIEPAGVGALQLALKRLHQKLAAEGLFAPERKRPLPRFPKRVAFVTSPTGAAVRDFLEVARRRWGRGEVLVIPVRVQGPGAAREIAAGIRLANRLPDRPDVLVIGRGGGSLEDLWCFNEEVVVRAVCASQVPVVSAVGHEIDVALSDLAADVRALTPSEAAERVFPSTEEVRGAVTSLHRRLASFVCSRLEDARSRLTSLSGRRAFRRPFDPIHERSRRLDDLEARLTRAARRRRDHSQAALASLAARLESLSPLSVLSRGYSITTRTADGELLSDAASVEPGQRITTRLAKGTVISRIEEFPPAKERSPRE